MKIQGPHGEKTTIFNLKSAPPPSHVVAGSSPGAFLKEETTYVEKRYRGASDCNVGER